MNRKVVGKNRLFTHYKIIVMLFAFLISIIFSTKVYAADIKATGISLIDKTSTTTVDTPVMINGEISSNIIFNEVNDYAIFDLTITNNESDKYKIESITDNNTNNNITVSYDYSKDYFNGENKIKIKFLYKNKLINKDKIDIENLTITIKLINNKGDSSTVVINNPITGDNILIYVTILILTVLGLIYLKKKITIKGFKMGALILLLSVTLLPFAIFAVDRFEVPINFKFIELKGKFETYTVSIEGLEDRHIKYGDTIGSLPTPSKEGYSFNGYVDQNNRAVTEDTIVTGPMTIKPMYTIITYNITYDLNGGSLTNENPTTYTIEDTITLNNPTKQGYTFSGWTGSNGTSLQTEVTISNKTGDLNYKANFAVGEATPYKVIHRYQNLNLTSYTEEVENLTGATDTTVTPQTKDKTGFTSPALQNLTIKGDGTSVLTYTYTRNNYILTLTNIEDIETTFTSGEYPYETQITVKAKDKQGYTFSKWSNNETAKEYTFSLTNNTELYPVYTPNTNTPYTVIHKKMNIDGTTYTEVIEDRENLTGETNTEVTPSTKTYTGFTSPSIQTKQILPDGSLVIEYLYTRNKYILTIENPENVEVDKSGEYYYESEITLKAKDKQGYTFAGWSNGETSTEITITMGSDNLTVGPLYTSNTDTIYTVIHKYAKLNGGYEEEEKVETGETGKTIDAPLKPKTGFVTPTVKQITIKADGTASVEYIYEREEYNFEVIDRAYIDSTSTVDGSYPFETEITIKAIEREGYTFAKWSNEENANPYVFTISEDTTINPVYTANSYNIIFDSNTGTGSMASEGMTYDIEKTLTKNTFTKTGYTFAGWNTISDGTGIPYIDEESVKNLATSGNVTLYAIWVPNDNTAYKVIHKYEKLDETYEEEIENLTGTTDTEITPLVKGKIGFISPDSQTTTINGDGSTEVTYIYNRERYVFTLQDSEYVESTKTSGEYPYGTEITVSPKTRDGYTFIKWSDNNTDTPRTITLSSNITIGPIYEINELNFNGNSTINKEYSTSTQTFIFDPASNGSGNYTYTITEGNINNYFSINETTVTIGSSTPSGEYTIKIKAADTITGAEKEATFVITIGKQQTEVVTNMSVTSAGLVTFTNSSNADGYLISIDGINYTPVMPGTTTTSINYLNEITAAKGTRTIYVKATNSDNDNYEESDPVTIDVTVYELSVNVNNNDYGTVSESSINVINGETFTTSGSTLTVSDGRDVTTSKKDITGYTTTFTGWSTNTGTINQDTLVTANYTRVIISYIVTFDTDGGSNVPSQTIDHGSKVTKPSDPTKEGYSFDKWYTDDTYETEFDFENTTITKTTTIYGKFNELLSTYTVTFDTDGGSSVSDIIVNQGDSIDTLPTTTKDDYIFDGWYENLTDTNSVSEPYTPTSDIELKAKWSKIICKKGTSLYTNECNSANGSGCRMKYAEGETITYGSIVSSDTFVGGDTLICDVDGTGYNEKFYYLRTIDDKAVLLHDKTMVLGSDTSDTHYVYSNAKNVLPSSSDWNQLPTTFEYDGVTKAARFPTLDDIKEATGVTNLTSSGALKNYSYLFEDIGKYTTTTGRSTVWLESDISSVSTIYRLHVSSDYVNNPTSTTSQNCVKPVIEVPINLISDDYVIRFNPNGGTMTNEFVRVNKGSSLGTLSTPTRADYIFDGWYTSLDFTTKVNENTVPNGYLTYYAKWIIPVTEAEVNNDTFIVEVNNTNQLEINNSSMLEPYTLESNDTSIATVDQNGIITGVSAGETTITIKGSVSHLTKTLNVRVAQEVSEFIVSFDTQGGSSVSDMTVPKNTAIGTLPTTTKTDYVFGGWFTNTNYSIEVTEDTIIDNNKTFYAKWIPEDAVAEVNNRFFTSIQDAIDDNTETTKTVKVLKDVTITSYIDLYDKNTEKNIVLDLNGHTITNNTTQTIRTKAPLEIKNGTIKCGSSNGAIDIETNGNLYISNTRVEQTAVDTNGRAAIYNKGGKVVIGENMYITSNALWTSTNGRKRGTVQNVSGTMTILGGTIINNRTDQNSYALSIEGGTVIVGTKDGSYDTESIVMQANTSGIYTDVNFSLYDGMVMGKTAAINNESKINSTEDNATKVKDTDDGYNRLYYTLPLSKYKVTFDANGGSVSPEFITIDIGDSVGELPTPTRGVYTFDGWYTGIDTGVEVTSTYVPEGNITIYARYHYEGSENIENFNMTNDAMTVYYNRLNTWLSDESTFQTNMDANMDNFNCSKCTGPNYQECPTPVSGTTLCDQSKGYDTGISTSVKVYESNDSKDIGTEVTYTTSTNGTIYNMIPGKVYYWESTDDSNVHGYVKASGNRRTIKSNVRNVRDMGGLEVDTNNDGTVDGTIKYGKIFRGAKLSSSASDVTELTKLGITEEVDLRGSSSDAKFSNYKGRSITNYLIYPDTHSDNYAVFRQALVNTMQDVINGENIYFHCAIGTDRTGTMAYFLEGLLGVNEEDRVQDYELSYFTGLLNRHRFHDYLNGSSINPRFTTMHNTYKTNQSIYEFFMAGSTNTAADQQLIDDFRNAMIDYN